MLCAPLRGECDAWWVPLSQAPQDLAALESVLSAQERERAAAFRVPGPRRQFVVARAALRTLLARSLDVPPSACAFSLNAHGKPLLQPPSPVRFNVSHAGDLVLIGIADGMDIGVDVEAHRREDDFDSLAASILCAADLAHWRAASAVEGPAAFYRIWTCKEAVAKAIGCGMAMDFPSLRIALAPGRGAAVAALDAAWGEAGAWSLRELETPSGYSAAVAAPVRSLNVTARTFEW